MIRTSGIDGKEDKRAKTVIIMPRHKKEGVSYLQATFRGAKDREQTNKEKENGERLGKMEITRNNGVKQQAGRP